MKKNIILCHSELYKVNRHSEASLVNLYASAKPLAVSESLKHEMLSFADRLATAHCVARARFVKQVQHDKKPKGFTLAEVLITLTIIGVIAVLTIPNLMQSWQERHTVSAVKEAYSLLDNAFKQMVREENRVDDWGSENITNDNLTEKLGNYLKIVKTCDRNDCYKDAQTSHFKRFSAGFDTRAYIANIFQPSYVLANGMIIKPVVERTAIQYSNFYRKDFGLGYIFVDINGAKGPNRYGYDIFFFDFDEKGLRPYGVDRQNFAQNGLCSINPAFTYSFNDGRSCYEWILKHGNVDYQKRDVKSEW